MGYLMKKAEGDAALASSPLRNFRDVHGPAENTEGMARVLARWARAARHTAAWRERERALTEYAASRALPQTLQSKAAGGTQTPSYRASRRSAADARPSGTAAGGNRRPGVFTYHIGLAVMAARLSQSVAGAGSVRQ